MLADKSLLQSSLKITFFIVFNFDLFIFIHFLSLTEYFFKPYLFLFEIISVIMTYK